MSYPLSVDHGERIHWRVQCNGLTEGEEGAVDECRASKRYDRSIISSEE